MDYLLRLEVFENKDLLIVIGLIFGILIFATTLFYIIGKIKPESNLTELKARTKSWWVMASVFILATVVNTTISYISLGFLSFMAFRELYSILEFRDSDRRAIIWGLISIPVQYFLAFLGWYGAFIIFIPVVMFLLIPMRMVLKGDTEGIIISISKLQWSLMLTVFGISHMAYLLSLPELEGFKVGGRGLLLFLVFLTEINDVMQFTFGKLFGKHKIIPKVSPNKTWVGFIGGVLATTAIGYGLGFLTPLEDLQLLLISFMIGFSGFIGDVVVSSIKRDIGIKYTGNSIPGHGGVLDRIDSLSYTATIFFHLIYYLAY